MQHAKVKLDPVHTTHGVLADVIDLLLLLLSPRPPETWRWFTQQTALSPRQRAAHPLRSASGHGYEKAWEGQFHPVISGWACAGVARFLAGVGGGVARVLVEEGASFVA
eukprot:241755-Chlamydomonas_euryale.AAC.1